MNIVIYPDKKATEALETINKRANNEIVKDQRHTEGELKTFYLKKRLY